jgi:uncharacterized RDD family membrane protein YckC
MTKEPELLKPQGGGGRPKVKPVAGFWLRAGAMIIDLLLFKLFIFYGLTFLFKEHLYRLGDYTLPLATGVIILYFTLLDGPVGKGKTLGKMLFNISVRDYDGNPLSFEKALLRSLINLNAFIVDLVISTTLGTPGTPGLTLGISLVSALVWAFIIANGVLIGVGPLKQGFADLYMKTLVMKDDMRTTYSALQESLPHLRQMQASAFQSASIAFIVIPLISGFMSYKTFFKESEKERMALGIEFGQEFPIEGFTFRELGYGIVKEQDIKLYMGQDTTPVDDTTTKTVPTSEAEELRYIASFAYMTNHYFDDDGIKQDPKIQDMLYQAGIWARENIPDSSNLKVDPTRQLDIPARDIEQVYFHFLRKIDLTFLYRHIESVTLQHIIDQDTAEEEDSTQSGSNDTQ